MMSRRIPTFAVAVICAALFSLPARAGGGGGPFLVWDVRDTAQAGQLTLHNADPEGTTLGEPVGCGDFDGDGYDDVVMCAFYGPAGSSNERRAAGKLHMWFGGPNVLDSGLVYDAAAPTAPTVEIWGARAGDFLGTEVDTGDVNGDGFADILACAENADGFGTDRSRLQAGALYVILGRQEWPDRIDLATSPDGVVEILGAFPRDRCGFWAVAGDVTGDGVKDIVVSADLSQGPSGSGPVRGAVYIIPGRTNLPARIDLGDPSTLSALGITAIYGIDAGDHLGSSLATGDFDGDGRIDIAVGVGLNRAGAAFSDYGEGNGQGGGGGDGPDNSRGEVGEAYILFGRESWPAQIQLADPPGNNMTIFYGIESGDAFGEEVRAGDVDGDGKDELAVGALTASPDGRSGAGAGYIFWSGAIQRGVRVDARTASQQQMTEIWGQNSGDIGADTLLLADVDADGLADLLFGSPTNTPLSRDTAGDLKVIFGSSDPFPAIVDTAAPPPDVPVYRIVAAEPGDLFTYSVAVGDVNGDGVTDIVPNAMAGDGFRNRYDTAGDAYVISGRAFSARAGRGEFAAPILSSVAIPDLPRFYAGQEGIVLTLVSEATEPSQQFKPGAQALLRGIAVPTEFVSATELRVRLDDAPDVRNTAGPLTVQVRNPGSEPSVGLTPLTLVGPSIRKAKTKMAGDQYAIKIKGADFLEGATVVIENEADGEVPVLSVDRRNPKTILVRIARDSVTSGATLLVRVVNPGPAPSDPAMTRVP